MPRNELIPGKYMSALDGSHKVSTTISHIKERHICAQFKNALEVFKGALPGHSEAIKRIIHKIDELDDEVEFRTSIQDIKKSIESIKRDLKGNKLLEKEACSSVLVNVVSLPKIVLDKKSRDLIARLRASLSSEVFSSSEFLKNLSFLMTVINTNLAATTAVPVVGTEVSTLDSIPDDLTGDLSLITRKVGREFERFSTNVMELYPNNPDIIRLKKEVETIYDGDNKLIKIIDLMAEFSWALFKIHDVNINSDKEYISQLAVQFNDLANSCNDISRLNMDSRSALSRFNSDFNKSLTQLQSKTTSSSNLGELKADLASGISHMQSDLGAYIKNQNEIIKKQENLIKSQSYELKNANTKLVEANKIILEDPLTGLANRRGYDDHFHSEFTKWSANHQHNLGLILVDIDYFKRVNDTYGHSVGDEVLQFIARVLMQIKSIFPTAYVSRYGGEEFAIIVSGVTNEKIVAAARIVHRAIEKNEFISRDRSVRLKLTASLGVAFFMYPGDTIDSVFDGADKSLYKAKESGRNSVWISRAGHLKPK